jgi:ubiquinone/menaquinone biosynthesis C-methylase UbiE
MSVWFSGLLDRPLFYNVFHGIVSGNKERYLRQELARDTKLRPLKVVDVGCGPGTNARLFLDEARFDYYGVDINPEYIHQAQQKFPLKFECVDITKQWMPETHFDIVLINSVLHHLTDGQADAVLAASVSRLEPDGRCLVMDMVYPNQKSIFNAHRRMLIHMDRGKYARTEAVLEELLKQHFQFRRVRPFYLRQLWVPLWDMRLYVGERKTMP